MLKNYAMLVLLLAIMFSFFFIMFGYDIGIDGTLAVLILTILVIIALVLLYCHEDAAAKNTENGNEWKKLNNK